MQFWIFGAVLWFNLNVIFGQQLNREIDLGRDPLVPNLPYPHEAMTLSELEEYERRGDRREEEGFWNLYPYGSRWFDADIGDKPFHAVQIDLDFDYPFYGFRFNYTVIYPNGLITFSDPEFIQPPYTFPEPKWPERKDASFIAPFYADQQFQFVGEKGISHVWYRTVHRPRESGKIDDYGNLLNQQDYYWARTDRDRYQKHRWGRVEDPYLLDNITRDIQDGIIGANGFRADYALIVTWERMGYGGAPKITEINKYQEVKRWLNTYQLVIATDEIRSYAMMNYGHVNWTSSNSAGALRGRGGKQSAMVGFNGGNGTGWTPLPYSGEGRVYKLAHFSNVMRPGRWLYRVDEQIIPAGCSNESIGYMFTAPIAATMLGGITVNVSGPCFRRGDVVKVIFDEYQVDCIKLNMIRAQCVLPVDRLYKSGLVNVKLSRDGGESYPYVGTFYLLQPALASPQIKLIDNPQEPNNNWHSPSATELLMEWAPLNLTGDPSGIINKLRDTFSQVREDDGPSARVDISLFGYWEDTDDHEFKQVGVLARGLENSGRYSFNPRTLGNTDMTWDAWRKFAFGVVRVSVTDKENSGVFWSKITPFGWYFRTKWEYEWGEDWALDMCKDWFSYDGRRKNFIMDLEPYMPCPCILDQALLDIGRYTAVFGCDRDGDSACEYNKGAQHCVMSVAASWTGAGQVCCYDFDGWLMHSDDYENAAYLRFYSPGVPQRAHPLGSYPFKRPPYVPSLSNYYTDIMPYEYCCKWAGHCEFYFWRRQTSGCQEYRPPAAGYVYGEPHFVTFDGTKYSFQGKGYYVLSMMKDPTHNFMVQIRMEQPPKTIWNANVNATVITGVAVQENQSDIIQLFARKDFRRWRYKMDILVNGIERYFDTPELKIQRFRGVTLRSPERNHNQSDIIVMMDSGAGVRVYEGYGVLNVMVLLPPEFNETYVNYIRDRYYQNRERNPESTIYNAGGEQRFITMGLLGTFNGRQEDDIMTPEGSIITVGHPPTPDENRRIFEYGERWRVDGNRYKMLFQDTKKPIYNPILFGDAKYMPIFDFERIARNASLIFTRKEVQVTCQNNYQCMYDYFLTGRREIALNTLDLENKLEGLKFRGSRRLISCGALLKAPGVVKHPPGNNYLDGVTVSFTCKPDFFSHGDEQRRCINGTWSPGWHVWCRYRSTEEFLKWMTGILTSLGIIGIIATIFICLHLRRKDKEKTLIVHHNRDDYLRERHEQALRPTNSDTNAASVKPIIGNPKPINGNNGDDKRFQPLVPVQDESRPAVTLHSSNGNRGYLETPT